jgi:hypothetical protein
MAWTRTVNAIFVATSLLTACERPLDSCVSCGDLGHLAGIALGVASIGTREIITLERGLRPKKARDYTPAGACTKIVRGALR